MDPAPSHQALPRELGDFLIELSIGVRRHAMYPPGHPSLAGSVQSIVRRLGPPLDARGRLSIGVARRQLVIEGVATDERHPVLSELARRLHALSLGAVSFEQGVSGTEIVDLLMTLAREPDADGPVLGLLPPEQLPSWPHIRVHPVGFEGLGIKTDEEWEGPEQDRATQLWLGLAQAALAGQESTAETRDDPAAIARSIRDHRREDAYDQVIVGYMLQLARELKTERGTEAERVRRRMAGLVREMDEDTLGRLVEMGGDYSARKRFVLDANQSLAVDTVFKVLQAAAAASGQEFSSSMTRLLAKLATHADQGGGRLKIQAASALRANVERLLDGWDLQDPNPSSYTRVLDVIARSAPILQARSLLAHEATAGEDDVPGPLRLVQTALEVDAWGPAVRAAVEDLIGLGRTGALLRHCREAPPGNATAAEILRELTRPDRLQAYLLGPEVDDDSLEILAGEMGDSAIPAFLAALADSESRSGRRKLFDRVRRMGPEVGRAVAARIPGEERWHVLRNWLALLRDFPAAALEIDPMVHLRHQDPRVRREALPLALIRPDVRDRALAYALVDQDERNCRLALAELAPPLSAALVPTVVNRVLLSDRDEALRLSAIRALAGSRDPMVRDALLGLAAGGRSLLGRLRLAEEEPLMLASLSLLAREWHDDPGAAPLLEAAGRSRSPGIRKALGGEDP